MANPNYVPPEGSFYSDIAIVGEFPGDEEVRCKRPFVGSNGKLLDDMLVRAGINRRECWITNVMKVKPPMGDFGCYYEDNARKKRRPELQLAVEELYKELMLLNHGRGPNVVIALGTEALKATTGKDSVDKWRGSIIEREHWKVIPTYHPGFVLRMYWSRAIVEGDLKRAREESQTKKFIQPHYKFHLEPSYSEVMEFLDRIEKNKLKVSFDIETVGQVVRCLGLAISSTEALSIPFSASRFRNHKGGNTTVLFPSGSNSSDMSSYWSFDEEFHIIRRLRQVMGDESIPKIAQNFQFDSSMLEREFGIVVRGLFIDTMILQHTCYSELPKGLDFLGSVYTRIPFWKDYDSSSDLSTWTYNLWDAVGTYEVSLKLEGEARELNVWRFYQNHAQPTALALTRCGNRGIKINVEARTKLKLELESKLEVIKGKIKEATGFDLNPNSPKQMKEFLYSTLGMNPKYKRKTGTITADEEAIVSLMIAYPQHRVILELVLDYREKVKLISTFLSSNLTTDGRMRTSFNATGTVNGRISSSATLLDEGGNLQQVPRGDFRRLFIASDGKVLVKVDKSQAEARAVAWLSKDFRLISRFLDPKFDIHRFNASIIYEVSEDQVSKPQRQQAKTSVHGANYRAGVHVLSKVNKIPLVEAKRVLMKYRSGMPRLEPWWKEIEDELVASRMLRSPHGRLRVFFDRLGEDMYRSATAFLPQATIADDINEGLVELDRELPDGNYPLLQVHDEILFELELDVENVVRCCEQITRTLQRRIIIAGVDEPLVIPIELSVGSTWFDQMPLETWVETQRR